MEDTIDSADLAKDIGGLHWFHWLIVSSSLVLTFFAWYISSKQVEEKVQQQFTRQAEQVVELIAERMRKYEDALWSGVATIHSQSQGIDFQEWRRFATTLKIEKRHPGINGIGVIYSVSSENMSEFLVEERRTRPDFHVFPEHENPILLPITYIEPVSANRKAVGLDVAHETNRLAAALKSRDSGNAQITAPIILVQDSAKTPGFLFYAPFYNGSESENITEVQRQKNFIGLVYAPFIFKNLLEGTLDKSKREVSLHIEDSGFVLYDEHQESNANYDSFARFQKDIAIDMYGRTWLFSMLSTKGFREQNRSNQPLIILVGGIFIDSLLLALFVLISRSNKNAIRIAKKMTRQYREKTKDLEVANAELEEFSYRTSHDLRSPLVSSIGLLDFAVKAINKGDSEKALASLKHIDNSLQKLQLLIEGILDLAKTTHLDEEKECVYVSEVIDGALTKFAHMENFERLTFYKDVESVGTVVTKKLRFQLIVENLLSNAIKYQDTKKSSSWVKISTTINNRNFILTIEDNGLGIPPNLQTGVFSMFKRFHTNTSYGSGLGLYMVKKSADRLGGKMDFCDGEDGAGTIFTLTILQ